MSFSVSGVGGSYGAHMTTGASMRMPPAQKMANLFDKIDTSGSGSISKSQLTSAFQTMRPPAAFKSMGPDAVYSALDPSNSGAVNKQAFVQGMTSLISQARASSV